MNQHFRNDMATNRMPPRFTIHTRCDFIYHTIWNAYWLISNPILYFIALQLSFVSPLWFYKGSFCCRWYDVGFLFVFRTNALDFEQNNIYKIATWESRKNNFLHHFSFNITINRVSNERLYLYSNGLFSLLLSCGHFKKFSQ